MEKILLSGQWLMQDTERIFLKDFIDAEVPGTVHTDLLAKNLIPDPFYGMNENDLQWVAEKEWIYKKEFSLTKEYIKHKKILLIFEGIDTYCEVFLNGNLLGKPDNMFRQYIFEPAQFLVEKNTIEIKFRSPIKVTKELEEKYGLVMQAPFNSIRSYARKAQCSFGWDWGPKYPTSGLWRDVYILGYDKIKIDHIFAKQLSVSNEKAEVEIRIESDSLVKENALFEIEVEGVGKRQIKHHFIEGLNTIRALFEIRNPKLWYPNGYGEQNLYNAKVSITQDGKILDDKKTKFGLRKIEIQQEKDEEGRNFVVKINDIPIFCKGMNWIPADSFVTRVSKERYEKHILLMKDANMNMARIWGGGIYESDIFYELCDEHGIMIWHDFMSACQEIPDHLEWFNDSFKKELTCQIKRLRNHVSIVVWCGNNENEGTRHGVWKSVSTTEKPFRYYGETMFYRIIPELCDMLDPTRPYFPSSPYPPDEYVYQSQTSGDFHSYEGWGSGDWLKFGEVKGRFLGEIGFQSFPDIETIEKFADEKERVPRSKTMLLHEKAPAEAINWIENSINVNLGFKAQNFADFVYLSQVSWAEGAKFCIEHWRRRKFDTSGILFWQLNDCWPSISWAFIDYNIRPKLCYFSAKKAFAQLIVSVIKDGEKIKAYLINDKLVPFKGKLFLRTMDLDGNVIFKKEVKADITANSKKIIFEGDIKINDIFSQFIVAELTEGSRVIYRNFFFPSNFGHMQFPKPMIEIRKEKPDATTLKLSLKSNCFTPAVKISASDGSIYSDNYLFLMPDEEEKIVVKNPSGIKDVYIRGLNFKQEIVI